MESYVGGAVEQVLRSRPLDYSVMSLNITCELVGSYTIDWSVRGGMNSSTIFPHSKLQIKNMNETMRVSCCSLDYGLVVVTVTVSMVGNKLINGLFTKSEQRIAYVNDTDIVVTLTQNRNRSYPYNSTVKSMRNLICSFSLINYSTMKFFYGPITYLFYSVLSSSSYAASFYGVCRRHLHLSLCCFFHIKFPALFAIFTDYL